MTLAFKKIAKHIAGFRDKWQLKKSRRRAAQVAYQNTDDYDEYLNIQLKRSVSKKNSSLQDRTREFVDRIADQTSLEQCDVLCVGCRNLTEITYFRGKGARSVIGIDLHSADKEVLIMDMHKMTFDDASFDLVYSSHSLEHAFDPKRAAQEFMRVLRPGGLLAIEAPVDFQPRGSDLFNFESVENIRALFGPNLGQTVWSERVAGGEGEQGKVPPPAVRAVFKLNRAQ